MSQRHVLVRATMALSMRARSETIQRASLLYPAPPSLQVVPSDDYDQTFGVERLLSSLCDCRCYRRTASGSQRVPRPNARATCKLTHLADCFAFLIVRPNHFPELSPTLSP